jgi:hypothetical protein
VPLQCEYCECRLTHFEPADRPPYFAPTRSSAKHRECELRQADDAVQPEPPAAVEPGPASGEALAEAGLEEIDAGAGQNGQDSAPAALEEQTLYAIEDTSAHEPNSSSWLPWLGIAPKVVGESDPLASERGIALPDARELLTLALNRRVPSDSQVRFFGQRYAIVSAAELHRRDDGELVAVYGRICDATWSAGSGRLTLIAAPRTVQVWATASVPRSVLGLRAGDPITEPSLLRPVPFIAFGRLKKLASVCGIPIIRRECFVLLLPLAHATMTPPIPSVRTTSLSDLTDELDQLLSAPLSVQPAQFVSAEAAIAQEYLSPSDDAAVVGLRAKFPESDTLEP